MKKVHSQKGKDKKKPKGKKSVQNKDKETEKDTGKALIGLFVKMFHSASTCCSFFDIDIS